MSGTVKLLVGLVVLSVIYFVGYTYFNLDSSNRSDQSISTVSNSEIQNSVPLLSNIDKEFVCRAAIAEMMGRSIDIVKVVSISDSVVRTSYIRPSDGKVWNNACRIDGDRVVWAYVENSKVGRWRNSSSDEIVKFRLSENTVTIIQQFADGSTILDRFTRGN